MTKPKSKLDERAAMGALAMLGAVCELAEARDADVGGHLDRMGRYAAVLAHHADIPDWHYIALAARPHDIGKVGIADGILFKPGPLEDEEFDVIRLHSKYGYDVLKKFAFHPLLEMAAQVAWAHHEQWDGSGYPRGLKGEGIPIAARVASIADAWDAMTTTRVYRKKLWEPDAANVIRTQAGKQFDPELAEAFLDLIGKGKV